MNDSARFCVDTPNPASSIDPGFKRQAPRPVSLQENDYLEKFDDSTLWYDAFLDDDWVRLTAPPPMNLQQEIVAKLESSLNCPSEITVHNLDRVSHFLLPISVEAQNSFLINITNNQIELRPDSNKRSKYKDKTVLFSKSKNNDLQWISDWVQYYVSNHGVDAVLLYDNGSTEYSTAEVLEAITVKGVDVATVVSWPFKFGPQGGKWNGPTAAPWDSDFCEYGIIEHARHKYLSDCATLIAHDIDELLVVEDNRSLSEHLAQTKSDYLKYSGIWVEDVRESLASAPTFKDYFIVSSKGSPTTTKWVANPKNINHAIQWKTHGVAGLRPEETPLLKHRHFKGITTNWKWQRAKSRTHPTRGEVIDYALASNMNSAYSTQILHGQRGAAYKTGSPESQKQHLKAIEEVMNPYRWNKEGLVKVWYWRPTALILDFIQKDSGMKIAFELRVQNGRVSLVATGRDKRTLSQISELAKMLEVPFYENSNRHWELDWWKLYVNPCSLAADCIQAITSVLATISNRLSVTKSATNK